MKKLFPIIVFLFIGCAKEEPIRFVLSGRVRVNGKVNEKAYVRMELCRGTEWFQDTRWTAITDRWGNYTIEVTPDWFRCDYRVNVFAQDTILFPYKDYHGHWDKMVQYYISDWKYGIARWNADTLSFNLDESNRTERQEEIIQREGPREKRYRN